MGKALTSIIIARIEYHIEISYDERQFGLTKHRSNVDAVDRVVRQIVIAREAGMYCKAVSLDVTGAFNSAWWPMLIKLLADKDCPDKD